MHRSEWYALYREIRTPSLGENLFPSGFGQRAAIGLQILKQARKDAWTKVMEDKAYARRNRK